MNEITSEPATDQGCIRRKIPVSDGRCSIRSMLSSTDKPERTAECVNLQWHGSLAIPQLILGAGTRIWRK